MSGEAPSRAVVMGDHRRPIWIDVLHKNDRSGRDAVLRAVRAARPKLVVDTGDLVPAGYESCWRAADADFAALRAAGVELEAVPGNHETYGIVPRSSRPRSRMPLFLQRFPREGGQRWGVRDFPTVCGAIRWILLDSNETVLSSAERREQERFLEREVERADGSSQVSMVLAAWHHPPFTNCTKYGDDRFSASSFLPRLRRCRKLAAIFCGHVHGYERFYVEGVHAVVTGGGGAHAHRLQADHRAWRHTPAFDAAHLPHLHFVVVDFDRAGATARAVHVRPGDREGADPVQMEGDWFQLRPRG
ncbi:MAG: metallophosphoesterase [Planctomycetes bacterium]|nr:metallophosphoesterase [Planctomycetota bacterium]